MARWLVATVAETIAEAPEAVTLRLEVPGWAGHHPGQHVDVRLTADDGYSTERSYSIASPPGAALLELTVVRFEDGEVSPYLTGVAKSGDQFELRGPVGGYFVWTPGDAQPVLLVGGGSGVVPLMAMLRYHALLDYPVPMHLIYSVRRVQDLLYRDELNSLAVGTRDAVITVTREAGENWNGRRGRVDGGLLAEEGFSPKEEPHCFVCGPTPFVEAVADLLVSAGHGAARVKTERFGPTGA